MHYDKDNDHLFPDPPQTPQISENQLSPSPNSEKRSVMSSIRTRVFVLSAPSRVPTVMLDPSTNHVSKHTFYVLNSQMKLKVSEKNEVMPHPMSMKYF
jgi:hypothetical protein